MKIAMLFPGQGSQYVGMGKDLFEEFPAVREIYSEADDILGFSLSSLSFEGDPQELTETRNAQPAILLHSVAVTSILREEGGIEPSVAAGHSLGEYSALSAAGVFEPMDALRIVRKRGELMFEAGLKQPGTMAAIIGLDTDVVEGLCGDVSREGSVVVVANINSPGQVVVSGHIDAVERAVEAATAGGAKKALKLNVSGAFHSPLVAPAQDELAGYISEFNMSDSGIDVICNVDAAAVRDSGQIKDALSRQLTSPVRWLDSMKLLSDGWEGGIIEAGPGKVLSGLMKRIDRERPVELAGTAEQVKKILASADAMK